MAANDRRGRTARGRLIAAVAVLTAAIAAAGCSIIGGGFAPGSPSADRGQTGAVSEENARIVAAYGGIYRDDRLEQTIAGIVSNIAATSDMPDASYRVTLLNAAAINAFALPDGHLYVTRGLLALASDASEVAAVLAHEMGHVTASHAAQREQKARNALIAQQAVADVVRDEQSRQLALAASERTLAAFSRQQELEADALGIKTVANAGYDPYAAARFLSAMAKFSEYRAAIAKDGRRDFLATHPATPERVQFAAESARAYGEPGAADAGRERYLAGIDGMIFGDDPSQGYVRDRSFFHPGLGIGFTVPAGFVLDNTVEALLATGGDGTALRFDAIAPTEPTDVAAYLRSGWVNGLDTKTVQAFSVASFAGASGRAQAKGWFFHIVVLQAAEGAIYRFIFANEAETEQFRRIVNDTVATFRSLSATEMASLKPLRVRLVTVASGDTAAALARRMKGVDRPRELFDVINGIAPGVPLVPGSRVKIITDS
jgi:predicted Zn-dependent protease